MIALLRKVLDFSVKYYDKVFESQNILLLSLIILLISIFNSKDINNAISLLNTIITSLSSILAIVISLTLVAIQLSSQTYSTRILRKFISPDRDDFWTLITLYLFSIFYSLFLLNSVTNLKSVISDWWVILISFSILLATWSLILLPKYVTSIINSLSPESTLEDLCQEIKSEFIYKLKKMITIGQKVQ